jgi:hydroxysqualene synthase
VTRVKRVNPVKDQPRSAASDSLASSIHHYENFPVGSWLVPAAKRPHVHSIYRFARFADDLADEGNMPKAERVAQLEALKSALSQLRDSSITELPPVVAQLKDQLKTSASDYIPSLQALLEAFIQDSKNTPSDGQAPRCMFDSEAALMDYCSRSANPVGRMMLQLFESHDAANLPLADCICSGLQWVNFMQDVSIDLIKGRIYIPQDCFPSGLIQPTADIIEVQTRKARALLVAGLPLLARVPFRLSLELRAIIAGGLALADKILAVGGDTRTIRPRLTFKDSWSLVKHFCNPS